MTSNLVLPIPISMPMLRALIWACGVNGVVWILQRSRGAKMGGWRHQTGIWEFAIFPNKNSFLFIFHHTKDIHFHFSRFSHFPLTKIPFFSLFLIPPLPSPHSPPTIPPVLTSYLPLPHTKSSANVQTTPNAPYPIPNCEVKRSWGDLVLWWVTTWETSTDVCKFLFCFMFCGFLLCFD
jgi:hypothetical protein